MALIPKYHVAAAMQAVDPSSLLIQMGRFVALYGTGVRRMTTSDHAYGVAGDTTGGTSYKPTQAFMPGISNGWQNRVSDGYDEGKASGKVTVYHSGGEFATDQFVNSGLTAVGLYLDARANSDTNGGALQLGGSSSGTVRDVNTVAQLTRLPGAYPSGVPGTDAGLNGDMALGANGPGSNTSQYIEFKLLI